jgi:ferrochelatase
MKIDDIVNIVDAELINNGYISDIVGFAKNLKRVKREYLFISNDINEIQKAIKKGAYAILFSDDFIKVTDKEIAWIKVEDIKESLLKLLKYKLLDKELYFTDEITLQIIKSLNKSKKLAVLDDSLAVTDFLNGSMVVKGHGRYKNRHIHRNITEMCLKFHFSFTILSGICLRKLWLYKNIFELVFRHNG